MNEKFIKYLKNCKFLIFGIIILFGIKVISAYTEYSSNGSEGIGGLFLYAKNIVSYYDALLFSLILLVITFSVYFIKEQKTGRGDFVVAFAVGSTCTTVLAVILGMLSGFTSGTTMGIFIGLTIISYIWLFFSEP